MKLGLAVRSQIIFGVLAAVMAVGAGAYAIGGSGDESERDASADKEPGDRRKGPARSHRGRNRGGDDDPRGADPDSDADLEGRVAKLEREVATMRRQLALVGAPRVATRADGDPSDAVGVDAPEFDDAVRDIVTEQREQEREQRWARRTERAMERLTEAAGLNQEQQTAISALWETERERLTPLILEARAGDRDFDEVRKEVEALREETDTEAGKMLSDTQNEAYLEHRPRGPGGRGRGGQGRGGQGQGGQGQGGQGQGGRGQSGGN